MKKTFKIVYIVLFFLMLCLPMALMPFFKNDAKLEKRALAKRPSYLVDGRLNLEYSDQFESWVNDSLPLRAKVLTVSNYLQGELLHGQTSNVIDGRDGWLFFASEAPDYMGTNLLTDSQIRSMAITLSLLQEQTEANGGHFLFVPVPNKSSVYREYMPARYAKGSTSNLTRLTAIMPEYDIAFADMLKIMTEQKSEGLYHRRDSHWNYRGALMAADVILTGLGRPHDSQADAAFTVEQIWRGDLEQLLLPAGNGLDEQILYDIPHADFVFARPQGVRDTQAQLANFMSDKEDHDDHFSTQNKDLADGSNLFMARDSFGRALLPYMIDNYETATFRRMDAPDLTDLPEGTDVVFEIAERNLARIIQKAPFAAAPIRTGMTAEGLAAGAALEVHADAFSTGGHIYGVLPDDTDLGDGRVYLLLEQDGAQIVLEAFPIYESLVLDGDHANGFSAYYSSDQGISGTYQLTVISGGTAYRCRTIDL
ncbi:MAG: hypothetical protein IJ917_05885 [Firmicutes bacterium]|nr:hypothetical protein [Bacillota bacterium]